MSKGTVHVYADHDTAHFTLTGTVSFESPGFVTIRWSDHVRGSRPVPRMESYPSIHVQKIVWEADA